MKDFILAALPWVCMGLSVALCAAHYAPLFPNCDVVGFSYRAETPWEAAEEFPPAFEELAASYRHVEVIANSISAYFTMCALPQERGRIGTAFGETLSWEYLSYVRSHPTRWDVPTRVLYGAADDLTDHGTVTAFCKRHGAELTVMEKGEHWFHTPEQMAFLDNWLRQDA